MEAKPLALDPEGFYVLEWTLCDHDPSAQKTECEARPGRFVTFMEQPNHQLMVFCTCRLMGRLQLNFIDRTHEDSDYSVAVQSTCHAFTIPTYVRTKAIKSIELTQSLPPATRTAIYQPFEVSLTASKFIGNTKVRQRKWLVSNDWTTFYITAVVAKGIDFIW